MHHAHFYLNPEIITRILNNPAFKEALIKIIGDVLKTEFIKECPNKDTVSVSVEATVTQTIKDMACSKAPVGLKTNHEFEIEDSKAMLRKPAEMHNVISGYETLGSVLALALEQAQNGKGNERHQVGNTPFSKQPICELARLYGVGYNFGQSAKKAHETQQLTTLKAKQAELLGAINFLAAAYVVLSEQA